MVPSRRVWSGGVRAGARGMRAVAGTHRRPAASGAMMAAESRRGLVAVLVAFAIGQVVFAAWTIPSTLIAP